MHRAYLSQTVAAARKLNIRLQILEARTPSELDSAFAAATRERADAMQAYADLLFNTHRTQILALAAKSRLPVLYLFKEDVVAGGLMSYGPYRSDIFPRAATYVDRSSRAPGPPTCPSNSPPSSSW